MLQEIVSSVLEWIERMESGYLLTPGPLNAHTAGDQAQDSKIKGFRPLRARVPFVLAKGTKTACAGRSPMR